MDDVEFCINDFIFNEELNPVISSYMRDAGSAEGNPFTFTVIDDETFQISFGESYGGFLAQISIAGWKGYTDWIKPAHYLKRFHKDYAEECHGSLDAFYDFIRPYAAVLGYDDPTEETVWVTVFNQIDCTNWECSDATDMLTTETFPDGGLTGNFPNLYAWEMTSSTGTYYYYSRNPYYFKVDADGQQLPYADEIMYYVVESKEVLQLEILAGNVDFVRAYASVDNLTLYRENAESANIETYVGAQHNHPTDIAVNVNYGLNADGTIKDDDSSRAWQEVINYAEFRKALAISIDAEEICDTVYLGMAEPQEEFGCAYDIDGANALLDEIGMLDVNGDGYRETPSGKEFQWQVWVSTEQTSDHLSVAELLIDYWREIGLHAGIYSTDNTLLSTSASANLVPMRIYNAHGTILYYTQDWATGYWCPLWDQWDNAGGMTGAVPADSTEYLAPPENVRAFFEMTEELIAVSPETAVNELVPEMIDFMAEYNYLIMHSTNIQKCVVANAGIGNMPTGGLCISFGFALETLYFR